MPLSESPPPGWYADPQGLAAYRWWDGLTWTAHTSAGQPATPSAQQSYYGQAETTVAAPPTQYPQAQYPHAQYPHAQYPHAQYPQTQYPPSQFRPTPQPSGVERNRYAFITLGIVACYVLIAWKAHIFVLGILPVVMSVRSKSRNEPLAPVAIVAAAVALLVAVLGFTHH
jgi:hypothetical protein